MQARDLVGHSITCHQALNAYMATRRDTHFRRLVHVAGSAEAACDMIRMAVETKRALLRAEGEL